jgi:multisubunit Na+/H+ antiporter MnhC subunit
MHNPAKEAYVMPIGIFFITLESAYMHKIIVIALASEGSNLVKPSELLAKLFDAVPRTTANNRNA